MRSQAFDRDDLVRNLTPAQRAAVLHVEGPQLILAGPGSGKTRVVTHRIANLLLSGISDRQIVALTFTNKAADEMRARVAQIVPGHNVWISTFHRFCSKLLRRYAPLVGLQENFSIYDTSDSQRLLRTVLESLDLDTSHYSPERIAHAISQAKNRLVTADAFPERSSSALGSIVARVYPEYQTRLLTANAVDFDDLLLHVAVLLRDHDEVRASLDERLRFVLVDEYQDTNLVQYAIVRALCQDYPNLSVTGDPDQSIYGWRGAHLGNLLEFENDYPDVAVMRLEQNFRSTQRILRVADALIVHNVRRKAKDLYTDNAVGAPVRLVTYPTHVDEAHAIADRIAADIASGKRRPRDFAIFYRINALSRQLELALRERGVPFQIVNSVEFFQRREIKDILGYLQLINNPRDDVALLRIINTPARGIGRTTLERLAQHARRYGVPLLEATRESGLIESLAKRAAVMVAKFVALFDRLCSQAHGAAVKPLMELVLVESGYEAALKESEEAEDVDRLANIQELLSAARQFDAQYIGDNALEAFLEQSCLVNDTDRLDGEQDNVSLMTIHSAKGLEFPVVHVIALKDGILPHERSRTDMDQLEEERRLLFVAITRGMEELQLSLARYRDFRGQQRMSVASSFLFELPRGEMEQITVGGAGSGATVWGASSSRMPDDPTPLEEREWRHAEHDDEDDAGDETADDGDISFDVAEIEAAGASGTYNGPSPRLTTGAELAARGAEGPKSQVQGPRSDGASGGQLNDHTFAVGMLVQHPEYGLGKVQEVSGGGSGRTVTVNFASAAGQRKFVASKSPLRPVR